MIQAKAERADGKGEVIGSYLAPDRISWIRYDIEEERFEYPTAEIKPETIRYQINGEWYSVEEIESMQKENARLREAISQADEILQELEDYTHGAIGDKITVARIKLKVK